MNQANENGPVPTPYERSAYAPHQEELLDEALEETFPASDPISPA
ncbi:hypothetical protein [Tsuneonella suprasediminis]